MEYLPAIGIAALFALLMAWSNDQDKKQYPDYSLRDDFVTLLKGVREITLKDAILIAWKLGVYVTCLLVLSVVRTFGTTCGVGLRSVGLVWD